MKIERKYKDEDAQWEEITEKEFIERTEGAGYWKPNTTLDMIKDGQIVFTPWATFRKKP